MAIIKEIISTPNCGVSIETFELSGDNKTLELKRYCIVMLSQGSVDLEIDGITSTYYSPANFSLARNQTVKIIAKEDNTKMTFCVAQKPVTGNEV